MSDSEKEAKVREEYGDFKYVGTYNGVKIVKTTTSKVPVSTRSNGGRLLIVLGTHADMYTDSEIKLMIKHALEMDVIKYDKVLYKLLCDSSSSNEERNLKIQMMADFNMLESKLCEKEDLIKLFNKMIGLYSESPKLVNKLNIRLENIS